MEIIQSIALLCNISLGGMGVKLEQVREEQIECQKYFVTCIETKDIKVCIKERK